MMIEVVLQLDAVFRLGRHFSFNFPDSFGIIRMKERNAKQRRKEVSVGKDGAQLFAEWMYNNALCTREPITPIEKIHFPLITEEKEETPVESFLSLRLSNYPINSRTSVSDGTWSKISAV